jgi:hypothetical protein
MADFEFNKALEKSANVQFNLEKLYGQISPSLVGKALYAVEGIKDRAREEVLNKLNFGFKLSEDEAQKAVIAYSQIPEIPITDANVYSYVNTPILQQIIFKSGQYNVIDNGEIKTRNFSNDYALPATCICEFNRSKVIAKSLVNGNYGRVKEQYGFDDWQINITGLIITEGNNNGSNAEIFPSSHIQSLLQWDEVSQSIEVESLMFQLLNIKRLSIEKISINDIRGYGNVKSLQIQATSDEALELIIKQNKLGN